MVDNIRSYYQKQQNVVYYYGGHTQWGSMAVIVGLAMFMLDAVGLVMM